MSTGKRLFWASRFLTLNILLCIGISWRLWFDFEAIPQVPVFDFLPTLIPLAQKIIIALALLYILGSMLFPKSRLPIGIGLLLLALVAIQDWNRIQPWLVQCMAMLILLVPLQRLYRKYEPLEYLDWALRLSLVGFYFWAGMFKLNPGFNDSVLPYVLSPITNYLTTYKSEIYALGAIIPYFEVIVAFGLVVPKISKYTVLALIGFHLGIILLIGPLGLNSNPIIWVWNLCMIGLLWLGIGKHPPQYNFKFWFKTNRITWFALALFTVLPALNYSNYYNKSVAFEIYSGTNYVANLKMPLSSISTVYSVIEPYSYKYRDSLFIRTFDMYDQEYNLPPNPDPKVLRKLEERMLWKME